ncbi:MAG: hypothetical protein Q8M66_02080 [Actinomycetota bacterium]|nr:hypothetical protein [Actinomycetota bacterium]
MMTLAGAEVDDGHVARLLASGFQGEEVGFVYLTIHPRRESTQAADDGV